MKRLLYILYITLCFVVMPARAEQWRLHHTYAGNVNRIFDTKNYTYVLSYNQPFYPATRTYSNVFCSLFRYDKEGEDMLALDVTNKLNSPVVTCAEYNYDKNYLMVVYNDGKIDLLHDNGDVTTIAGLATTDESTSKKVWSVTFDPKANKAYLATDFGYIVVSDEKGEVSTSLNVERKINSVFPKGDKVFLATDGGVFYVEPESNDRTTLHAIPADCQVARFIPVGDKVYTFSAPGENAKVGLLSADSSDMKVSEFMHGNINAAERVENSFLVSTAAEVNVFDKDGQKTRFIKGEEEKGRQTVGFDGRTFWVDMGYDGVVRKRAAAENPNWSPTGEVIRPNASTAYMCSSLAYSPKYGMLVRNHRADFYFTTFNPELPDLICGVKNLEWTPYSLEVVWPEGKMIAAGIPAGIAIDPLNPDQVYCGSPKRGLSRIDLSDPRKSFRIGRSDDEAMGKPNFVGTLKNPKTEAYWDCAMVGHPYFDSYNNLWVAYATDNPVVKGEDMEIWCWTADDRKASTNSATYRAPKKIVIPGTLPSGFINVYPMTSAGARNTLFVATNNVDRDYFVIDHKGTFDTQTDDKIVAIKKFVDQEGQDIGRMTVQNLYEDKTTGQLWVATDVGVFYFNPQDAVNSGQSEVKVTRPKVARNDGTELADYLLSGVPVNAITIDGQGRKWFATNGGGLVVTSANGSQVLKTYTTDNSMLPNDIVYALEYNPQNNSMMTGTRAGLAELFLSGTASDGDGSGIVAYPNPVRPDYYGYVTIEGLEDGAMVKITDNAGNLIKELGFAEGGTAQWDVTNYNMKRVRSGVYYVMASGGPESSGYAAVTKILVIN